MTTRDELAAFKSHPLWESLEECIASFEKSVPKTATDRATIERALACTKYALAYRPLPPALFPSDRAQVANYMRDQVQGLTDQWSGWNEESAMTQSTVQQIDAYCDGILNYLRAWPSLQKESRAAIFQQAADSYSSVAEASLEGLEKRVQEAEAHSLSIDEQVNEIARRAIERDAQSDSTLEELEATRALQAENAEVQLQAELSKAHKAAADQRKQHGEELLKAIEAHAHLSDAAINQLQADARQGQALLQLVGDQSQAEGYVKFANRERNGYRLWMALGFIVALATLTYLAYEFQQITAGSDPAVGTVIFKTAFSVSALAFAGVCFREAGKRQRQSLDARYRALDLLALRPFTEGMAEEDAKILRAMLGERLFKTQPEESHRKSDEKVTTLRLDIADIKAVADTAKSVRDAGGL